MDLFSGKGGQRPLDGTLDSLRYSRKMLRLLRQRLLRRGKSKKYQAEGVLASLLDLLIPSSLRNRYRKASFHRTEKFEVLESRCLLAVDPFYINAGGAEYTATTGELFVADQAYVAGGFGYVDGTSRSNDSAISGTEDDILYQSIRSDRLNAFSYLFDGLENGDYDITLRFAELQGNALAGDRIFDVAAEGNLILDDFDVVAASGGTRTAYDETFTITVTDGQLNLDFTPANGNFAYINAISVVSEGGGPPPPTTTYVDVAEDVGLVLSHDLGELLDPEMSIGSGSAWADYDNDGDIDLFVTNRGGANRLYQNDGDTSGNGLPNYAEVASSAGVDDPLGRGHSAVFIDYDNDGDQDLYVTNWGGNILWQNQLVETGQANFLDVTDFAGVQDAGRGITTGWADFDQDGFIDFYIAKHMSTFDDPQSEDRLYRNNGDGTFADVSNYMGDAERLGLGFVPGWVDYDNDGDQDLYLVNDAVAGNLGNVLWRNDGSDGSGGWTFTDVSAETGAGISLNGMGLGVGDYNNDGFFDFAISNIGNNVLLQNNGATSFTDVAGAAGVSRATLPGGGESVTWGTAFFDYDNDGLEDLYIVAGNIDGSTLEQPNALFANNGDDTFTDISAASGLDHTGRGRSASIVDFDGDGFVDIFLGNFGERPYLYQNASSALGNTNASVTITVEGTVSNRDGIGTRLWLTTSDGVTQMRDISSGRTHGGGDYRAAYFGLGDFTSGELVVQWPTGEMETIGSINAGDKLHLVENDPTPPTLSPFENVAAQVGIAQAHQLGGICFPPLGSGSAWADHDNDGDIDLFVTNQGGANWLYRNDGDTDFDGLPNYTDVALTVGVDDPSGNGLGAVFIDYDNDGDQDLYVTNWGGNTLYQNQLIESGSVSFLDVTATAGLIDGGRGITSAWADFDKDGDLDVYIAKHLFCDVDRQSTDGFYRNNGDGTFEDIGDFLGFDQRDGLGFSPGWFDYDNDGDEDLYLVNDTLNTGNYPNVLWRNDGSDGLGGWIFTDVSVATGADKAVNGMGLGLGDYDNDGWVDIAFSNILENSLLRNVNGTFDDVSAAAGIERALTPEGEDSVTWATGFLDLDNDRLLDLFYVAGPIQGSINQPNAFFQNNGDGTFDDISAEVAFDDPGTARSASMVDFDGDGYVDVYIGNYGEAPLLYRNTSGDQVGANEWLQVTVAGTVSNRDAIGTRLWLTTSDGVTQLRDITSGPTHGGGDYRAANFGLENFTSGQLTVRWPTGEIQDLGQISSGQILHLVEPSPTADPDISVAPLAVDFGSITVGQTVQGMVTITNTGSQTLSISSLATTNAVFTVVGPATPVDIAPGGNQQVTLEFQATVAGTELGELQITSNDPDEGLVSVALTGNGVVAGGGIEFYINVGGGDYTTTTGVEFVADKAFVAGDFGYTGGRNGSSGAAVANTVEDVLYQTVRANRNDPINYTFDAVPNSDYEVTLYFSELSPSAGVGTRIFDVLAEGAVRLDDVDVVAAAGAVQTAYNETFIVTVSDGQLNLDFVTANSTFAFVNAISVVELSPAAAASVTVEQPLTSGLDFLAWQRGFGTTTNALRVDDNTEKDSNVDANNLAVWAAGFGRATTSPTSIPPQPTALAARSATIETAALVTQPLLASPTTAQLLDAAIAWESASGTKESKQLIEEQLTSEKAVSDAAFLRIEYPSASISSRRLSSTAENSNSTKEVESGENGSAWLSDDLLEQVFG